ncbi:hypothetical protein [Geodermatophilus sp. SYSU D00079]
MTGGTCRDADHRPPVAGGACPCGMVTRVPARPAGPETVLRELVPRLLDDAAVDPAQAADRLLAALAAAGVSLQRGVGPRLPA